MTSHKSKSHDIPIQDKLRSAIEETTLNNKKNRKAIRKLEKIKKDLKQGGASCSSSMEKRKLLKYYKECNEHINEIKKNIRFTELMAKCWERDLKEIEDKTKHQSASESDESGAPGQETSNP
jgi:hypothetical protein